MKLLQENGNVIDLNKAMQELLTGEIQNMREWLSDCQWGDIVDSTELFDSSIYSDIDIVKAVDSHYDGRLLGFLKSAGHCSYIAAALYDALMGRV